MCLRNKALAPWIDNPYWLVSLGEIMKLVSIHDWINLARMVEKARAATDRPDEPITEEVKGSWAGGNRLEELCEQIGLKVSAKSARRVAEQIATGGTWGELEKLIEEFQGRLEDELESELFLHVGAGEVRYYQDSANGWQPALAKFPSIAFDIEEAGKCLALSRGTASVFHLMRVLEAGLYALATELGVPLTKRNWGTVIDRIEKEIRKRDKAGPGAKVKAASKKAWQADIGFYFEAAAQFMYLKDAWRNRTAHAGTVYTVEKAESIFNHVRDFMQHLSTKLAERDSS